MQAHCTIEMPYEPKISVNSIHYQGNVKCDFVKEAQDWFKLLTEKLDQEIFSRKPAIGDTVILDLHIYRVPR